MKIVAMGFIALCFLTGCATTDNKSDAHEPTLPAEKPAYSGGSDAALTAAKMF